MTINLADNSPRISYAVAQGATQTSFAVPFEFFASADLNVYVDGTLKTLTTHYTVSGGDGSTGTVTISVTGATGGSTVVITRDVALERTTDFPSSGPFQIGALNTELDCLTAIAADLDDKAGRALQLTDFDVAASLVLPTVDNRKGKTLAFNASSGAVEAGPTISDVQTVSAAAADIQTLAHIEDGTDATDAIQTVAGIASNVSTVAGVSSAVSTVAGISSNVTAVAADATDIGVVAGKAAEIGRLGTAQAVADLDILATTDAVSDMNTLAAISANISTVASISANVTSVAGVASLITSDFVADLNTLATTDIVSDLNTLATADIVSDLNTLATSDIVSDLNTLATADIVSDLNTLATTDIVSDLNTLATTDIVTDLNLLATSAIVEDLNLLATSTVIADMATLAGAGANPNISSLGVSGTVTAGGLTVDGNILLETSGNPTITNKTTGSGNNPSYRLQANTNYWDMLGVFSDADDTLRFRYNNTDALEIANNGDISFYEDTGSTAKFFWDASAESLQIGGTTNIQAQGSNVTTFGNNFVLDGGYKYLTSGAANMLYFDASGNTMFFKASSGTAGATASFSETMRIDSSGHVGIGTTTPNAKITLKRSGAGLLANGDDGTVVALIADTTGSVLTYGTYTSHPVTFKTANGERMRIDSSGHLLVGTTAQEPSVSNDDSGFSVRPVGTASISRTGGPSLDLNRKSSDGYIAVFRKDGSTVGSISSRAGTSIDVNSESGDLHLQRGGTTGLVVNPTYSIPGSDAGASLGISAQRWSDLYLSGGVYLGGTVAANKLDDYEEGSWTPTCAQASISINSARYTKIGDIVHLIAYLGISSATGAAMTIGGIPFSVASNGWAPSIVNKGANASIVAMVRANASSGTILDVKDPADLSVDADQVGTFFIFSLTYRTA